MAAAKKWAQEGISIWEVECHLDSELFLNEYPRWTADGPQHPWILQRIFAYMLRSWDAKNVNGLSVEATSSQSPREDTDVKTLAIQMVGFQTTQEEVQGIYNEVCQQKRLPGPPPYGSEWMEALDREICASLEEQMQGTARPGEDQREATTSIIQPSCQVKSHHQTLGRNEDPHDQALKEARETHQRALEAAGLNVPNASAPIAAATPGGGPKGGMSSPWAPMGWKSMWPFLTKKRRCLLGKIPWENPWSRWLEVEG